MDRRRLIAASACLCLCGMLVAGDPPHAEPAHVEPAHAGDARAEHAREHGSPAGGPEAGSPGGAARQVRVAGGEPGRPEPGIAMLKPDEAIDAERALALLVEGNERWLGAGVATPNLSADRRAMLARHGQRPFATILTCADSRVPVERLFDRGIGDVFVARVAGNVAGVAEVGTVEYGVGHLRTPLLVIMGHTRCGAVQAATESDGHATAETDGHGHVAALLDAVAPAVERARRLNPHATLEELVEHAVRENVWQSAYDLFKSSPRCRELVSSGQLVVVGAVYDIESGRVHWMGSHPWERELLAALGRHPDGAGQQARDRPPPAHGVVTEDTGGGS